MSGVVEGNISLSIKPNFKLFRAIHHSYHRTTRLTSGDPDSSIEESTSLHDVTVEDDTSQVSALSSMESIPQAAINLIEPVETEEAVKLGYPPLNFNFGILKTWVLILTMVVWTAVIGGVVALTITGSSEPNTLHLRLRSNYYSLRYGPSVIGTITTIWWRALTQSYNRIIPYVVMANMRLKPKHENPEDRIIAQRLNPLDMDTFDVRSLLQLYRSRHYVTLIVNLSSISMPLLVPLKGSFIQITRNSSGWGVNVQPVIGWIIVTVYSVLLGTTLAVLLRLSGRVTGLKWNPCSLAAQLVLLRNSDVPIVSEGLEFCTPAMLRHRIHIWGQKHGSLRLGYWRNKQRPEDLFHCIRFLRCSQVTQAEGDDSTSQLPERLRGRQNIHPTTKLHPSFRAILDRDSYEEHETPIAYRSGFQLKRSHYWARSLVDFRYTGLLPVWLNDNYIVSVLIIMLACLIVLAVTLGSGTLLQVHSYAGFIHGTLERGSLFTALPSFVISLTNIVFLHSDAYHRMHQPIRGMDKPTAARENILVDYLSPNPLAIIYTALSNCHFRVAWGTFVALICPLGPLVAGGIFTFDDDAQTFQASPVSTYAVLAIVCLYIPALPFARMDVKYSAGRGVWNIIDTLSLCYDSPILQCPEFRVREKTETEEIFLRCRVILAKRLYQFGFYLGESGRRRMGFSVAKVMSSQSSNSRDLMRGYWIPDEDKEDGSHGAVYIVDRIKSRFGFWRFNFVWFRRPQIVKSCSPHCLRRVDTEMATDENRLEGNFSVSSGASRSESFESEAYEMATPNQGVVGGEGEAANATTEVAIAQSTAVRAEIQELNTLLRRQSTLRVDD